MLAIDQSIPGFVNTAETPIHRVPSPPRRCLRAAPIPPMTGLDGVDDAILVDYDGRVFVTGLVKGGEDGGGAGRKRLLEYASFPRLMVRLE
mmetsp:Transcript_63910/g.75644  ORF Transcript_63910/g.75644 Transcript_63910/m.75644 type:complete len:91 (+) Transcript_63910:1444-1716(+)